MLALLTKEMFKFSALTLLSIVVFSTSALSQEFELPVVGVWNGFNEHINVLECSNGGVDALSVTLLIKSNGGEEKGAVSFSLPPHATHHVVLNEFDLENEYGTYELSVGAGEDASKLSCLTAFYRIARPGASKPVEYAFVIPTLKPLSGISSGVFNSISPAFSASPVLNWLSVYNPERSDFSAQVLLYRQDGTLDEERSFDIENLAPGERRDYALGHDRGQVVGLYQIAPQDSSKPYGAFITRYGLKEDNSFAFAFPLSARAGSCAPAIVPASTMGNAYNWGELANPTDSQLVVSAELREQSGVVLYSDDKLEIAPHSQIHLPLHEFLGASNLGRLSVQCADATKKLLVESLFYGKESVDSLAINWAYASQPQLVQAQAGDTMLFPVNTFFQAANWSKLLNTSLNPLSVVVNIYDADGKLVTSENENAAAAGSVDIGIHSFSGDDFIGLSLIRSSGKISAYSSELLRVFPDTTGSTDGVGYIMNVPSRVLANSSGSNTSNEISSSSSSSSSRSSSLSSSRSSSGSFSPSSSSSSSSSLSSLSLSSSSSSSSSPSSSSSSSTSSGAPWTFSITPTHATIITLSAILNGQPLTTGDWIGSFDQSGHCYGAAQVQTSAQTVFFNAYGDDGSGTNNGFVQNERIYFRFYQASSGREFSAVPNPAQDILWSPTLNLFLHLAGSGL